MPGMVRWIWWRIWFQDPLMTAKILQVINSANFALGRQINDVCEAVMYLGVGRTRPFAPDGRNFSQYENTAVPGFAPERSGNHSLQVGTLCNLWKKPTMPNWAKPFTSGLMHDMGKLILAANVPAMRGGGAIAAAQNFPGALPSCRCWGPRTPNRSLSAGHMGIAAAGVEAVAWHHCPARTNDDAFTPLTAVHAANVFPTRWAMTPLKRWSVSITNIFSKSAWATAATVGGKARGLPQTTGRRRRAQTRPAAARVEDELSCSLAEWTLGVGGDVLQTRG